jgi:lambda family phage portal protein
MAEKPRIRVPAGSQPTPQAAFFRGERQMFLNAWRPALRESRHDVRDAWQLSAARAVESLQNSGFIAGGAEASSATVVGPGLRMSARPDYTAMGWTPERGQTWSRMVESRWAAYSTRPIECDAAGKMTVNQMQQAAYACYLAYGEVLAVMPLVPRRGVTAASKVALIPPSRLVDKNLATERLYQGVYVDAWGMPEAYIIRQPDDILAYRDVTVAAHDRDGRPNILHVLDPAITTTRGISPIATVLKVIKQVDQFCDATLTTALIQTIFAATLKTSTTGVSAFDGLVTENDIQKETTLNLEQFGAAKANWYEDAKLDLSQHGRIAHLFPGDELDFKSAQHPNAQFNEFMRWMLMEVARGFGISYETLTGDYRGATYSSVRMAGAMDWLTVMRRRENIVAPFAQTIYENWLEEEIGTGRIEFPGGVEAYRMQKGFAAHAFWTGPPRPQADEFKAARAQQVLKEMGATTMSQIAADYGVDWDDMMRQQKAENDLADALDLPRPWAITDPMQKPEGEELALNETQSGNEEKRDRKKDGRSTNDGGVRSPGDTPEPQNADDTDQEIEADLGGENGEPV